MQKLINQLSRHPKWLFLIDGLGALVSAIMLGVILVSLSDHIGIPPNTLYLLATFPVCFALYDFICYRVTLPNPRPYLRTIAALNVLYIILSLGLAYHHRDTVTPLGWTYILAETAIVLVLAYVEWSVANTTE